MKKLEVVDLNESIRRTAKLATDQITLERIQLNLKLSSKSPHVLAHPAKLTQALLSLLRNAIDSVSAHRSSGTIQITSAVIRDHVLVSVADDGPRKDAGPRFRMRLSQDI